MWNMRLGVRIAACVLVLASSALWGVDDVDLTWKPDTQIARLDGLVEFDLHAVSDGDEPRSVAAMDVVLTWDADQLEFLDVIDNGSYDWQFSGFLPDPLDGLNASLADGDAKYTALSRFGETAYATPEGLLVTTFRFRTLELADESEVVIEVELGKHSVTTVFGGEAPDVDVTGQLGQARLAIRDDGDCDGNEAVDLADFGGFQACFTGAGGAGDRLAYPIGGGSCCRVFDLDDDGVIDLWDYAAFRAISND